MICMLITIQQMHSSQPTVLTIPNRYGIHKYMNPLRSVHIDTIES